MNIALLLLVISICILSTYPFLSSEKNNELFERTEFIHKLIYVKTIIKMLQCPRPNLSTALLKTLTAVITEGCLRHLNGGWKKKN